ncbi:hypothetical protein C0Q70_10370 [Pomacea canaliculata]|uniref:Methyltransferase small domain-containing protein n=1 Tax=Pomacea canaliculata TaxID=400727 RepID=A0A2T7PCF7_POMCA|nr:hypothetical protein C0Q70_10370 [Pomacea canaliculata]
MITANDDYPKSYTKSFADINMSRRSVSRKKLESYLQEVDVFDNPKMQLEQYPTTPHLAASMLHTIHTHFNDLEGKCVADLGVGSGVLSLGCSMLGCSYVLGVDIDPEALAICANNISEFDITNIDLLHCDIRSLVNHPGRLHGAFDVVVMNPPFGTKNNQGIDMLFLQAGLALARTSVYSLHKTSTREVGNMMQ